MISFTLAALKESSSVGRIGKVLSCAGVAARAILTEFSGNAYLRTVGWHGNRLIAWTSPGGHPAHAGELKTYPDTTDIDRKAFNRRCKQALYH